MKVTAFLKVSKWRGGIWHQICLPCQFLLRKNYHAFHLDPGLTTVANCLSESWGRSCKARCLLPSWHYKRQSLSTKPGLRAGPSLDTGYQIQSLRSHLKYPSGTSLVAQWLRILLPMQGTQDWALVWEGPTCRGAVKPVSRNYWACALEPSSPKYRSLRAWSPCSATREATAMRRPRTATKSSPRSPQLEKARMQQRRPNAAKNK